MQFSTYFIFSVLTGPFQIKSEMSNDGTLKQDKVHAFKKSNKVNKKALCSNLSSSPIAYLIGTQRNRTLVFFTTLWSEKVFQLLYEIS